MPLLLPPLLIGLIYIAILRVTVLEARDRVGGRVHTDKSLGGEIDLGAMVVTGKHSRIYSSWESGPNTKPLGTIGNPVYNLIKQVKEDLHVLESGCPLYTSAGIPPPQDVDDKVEKDFNDVLKLTNKVRHVHQLHLSCNGPSLKSFFL